MPRALIVGSGVAGTVAGVALRRAGWDVDLYEAYDHSAGLDQGIFLTLAVNGLDALRAVEADDAVRALGFPTGKIRFATSTGRQLGAMDIGPRLADGTVTRTMRRADLYRVLYDLARQRGATITHGKRLVDARSSRSDITAVFSDGTTATGDVLIGADGIRSTVRTLIDQHSPRPHYTGMGNTGGFAATNVVSPDGGDYRMIWGRRCFFGYTVSPDGQTWWFANPPSRHELAADEVRNMTTAAIREHLLDLFDGDQGPMSDIIRSTEGPIVLSNQYDMPRVPRWYRDRMVIIGDAAHAVSPSTGQGVSLACEDAVLMAMCLRDVGDVPVAFAAYERLRRPRVERVVAWGAKMGGTKTAGPVMRVVRDLMLPRILAKGSTPEAMAKQAWMFDHHVDWEADALTRAA